MIASYQWLSNVFLILPVTTQMLAVLIIVLSVIQGLLKYLWQAPLHQSTMMEHQSVYRPSRIILTGNVTCKVIWLQRRSLVTWCDSPACDIKAIQCWSRNSAQLHGHYQIKQEKHLRFLSNKKHEVRRPRRGCSGHCCAFIRQCCSGSLGKRESGCPAPALTTQCEQAGQTYINIFCSYNCWKFYSISDESYS